MDAGTVYYTDFSKEFLFQILRGPLRTVILKNYLLSTSIESLNFSMMYLLRYTVTFRNKNWFSAQVSVKLPGWRAVVRRLAALRGQLPAPRPGHGTPQGPLQRTGLPSNCHKVKTGNDAQGMAMLRVPFSRQGSHPIAIKSKQVTMLGAWQCSGSPAASPNRWEPLCSAHEWKNFSSCDYNLINFFSILILPSNWQLKS